MKAWFGPDPPIMGDHHMRRRRLAYRLDRQVDEGDRRVRSPGASPPISVTCITEALTRPGKLRSFAAPLRGSGSAPAEKSTFASPPQGAQSWSPALVATAVRPADGAGGSNTSCTFSSTRLSCCAGSRAVHNAGGSPPRCPAQQPAAPGRAGSAAPHCRSSRDPGCARPALEAVERPGHAEPRPGKMDLGPGVALCAAS